MDIFHASIQSWQTFYATVAAAAATLTGLLFVSLSLNRDRLKGKRGPATAKIARTTFGDFLYVIMISLVFLVPHQIPLSLTVALLALGLSRMVGIAAEAAHSQTAKPEARGMMNRLREIGLPGLVSVGLIVVGVFVALGRYEIFFGLVGVIAALLISACWNAWILLIAE